MSDLELQHKSFSFKVDKFDDESRTVKGLVTTYGNIDLTGDIISKGAFKTAHDKVQKGDIRLLLDHSPRVNDIVGKAVDVRDGVEGLEMSFKISEAAQDVYLKLKEGLVQDFSVGFFIEDARDDQFEGKDVRVIEKAELVEVSLVVFPANPQARITEVKAESRSDGVTSEMEGENSPTGQHYVYNKNKLEIRKRK